MTEHVLLPDRVRVDDRSVALRTDTDSEAAESQPARLLVPPALDA